MNATPKPPRSLVFSILTCTGLLVLLIETYVSPSSTIELQPTTLVIR